jgi:hypothetical protein
MQLSDKELWAAVSTLVLPLIIALVQQPTWSDRVRAIVGFVAVFIWTALGVLYVGDGVPQRVVYHTVMRLGLTNFLVSWATYSALYKPAGITQRIEAMSSPDSGAKRELLAEAERKSTPPRDPIGGA